MSDDRMLAKIHRVREYGYAIFANLSADGMESLSVELRTIVSGLPIWITVGHADTMHFREEKQFVSIVRETISRHFHDAAERDKQWRLYHKVL